MSLCKDAYPEVVREERPSEFSIDAVSDGPRQHGTHTAAGTTQRHRSSLEVNGEGRFVRNFTAIRTIY